MIDSAQAYNEEHVGVALEESGIPREEIFIVSKVHPRFLGYEETLQSVEESLKKLKVQTNCCAFNPQEVILKISYECVACLAEPY